jgi:hypothetical protein
MMCDRDSTKKLFRLSKRALKAKFYAGRERESMRAELRLRVISEPM